jgi:hypothetical protein
MLALPDAGDCLERLLDTHDAGGTGHASDLQLECRTCAAVFMDASGSCSILGIVKVLTMARSTRSERFCLLQLWTFRNEFLTFQQ